MPTDKDLFLEEQQMVAMSFGDHIEELRLRLILALLGLAVGVLVTFLPPLNLGMWVMSRMQRPAQAALEQYYADEAAQRAAEAKKAQRATPPIAMNVPAEPFIEQLRTLAPELKLPAAAQVKGKTFTLPVTLAQSDLIPIVVENGKRTNALVSLAPLESITIFFTVCLVTGLVLASPWVFYHLWAFVAAGLYRHERKYVYKFLPISLGLFLCGVLTCFFAILPVTLSFLLQFNTWVGIEPTLRLTEWMGFATVLPLVFGVCFETPLVMLFLERIGIFTVATYRSKRKYAILIMVIAAAILTPTPDVFTQSMLAVPMIGLYELGIFLVAYKPRGSEDRGGELRVAGGG